MAWPQIRRRQDRSTLNASFGLSRDGRAAAPLQNNVTVWQFHGAAANPCRLPAFKIRLPRRPISDSLRSKDAPAGFCESWATFATSDPLKVDNVIAIRMAH